MSKVDILCRSAGVRLVGKDRRCRPGESRARQTIRRLALRHGDEHVRLVLRLIVESRNNRTELHAETIMAMSAVILANPAWEARSGLMDAMDRIELGPLRQRAKASPTPALARSWPS